MQTASSVRSCFEMNGFMWTEERGLLWPTAITVWESGPPLQRLTTARGPGERLVAFNYSLIQSTDIH